LLAFSACLFFASCAPVETSRDVAIESGALVCPSRQALSDAIQAGWETPACRTTTSDTEATLIADERGELRVRIDGESADAFVQASALTH
jgi:hypothetical protein